MDVSQVGTLFSMDNIVPLFPFAKRVPVPLAPPYIRSPEVVIGDNASNPADFVVAPVPPFTTGIIEVVLKTPFTLFVTIPAEDNEGMVRFPSLVNVKDDVVKASNVKLLEVGAVL